MGFDSIFMIGDDHQVCEDYALANGNCLVLSDGCSSSVNTDIGSRMLCHAVHNNINIFRNMNFSLDDRLNLVLYESIKALKMVGLSEDAALCTLLMAIEYPSSISFHIIGDGSIFLVKKNKDIIVYDISFPSNAPKYLSYRLSSGNRERFNEIDKGRKIDKWIIKGDGVELLSSDFEAPGSYKDVKTFFIDKSELKVAGMASDGMGSFYTSKNTFLDTINIYKSFLPFKNLKGEFVKRRLKRFEKTLKEDGNTKHYDDISVAAMTL
jgi:hypothetical protein